MDTDRCRAITLGGTRCTKKAIENGCCYIPAHKRQLLEQSKSQKIIVPTRSTLAKLKEHHRVVDPTLSYSNLGYNPELADKYYFPEKYKRESQDLEYPEEFLMVASEIETLCNSVGIGYCSFHPTYPGVQWSNKGDNYEPSQEKWKLTMFNQANHYAHHLTDNPEKIWGPIDPYYCMCQERKASNIAYNTLMHVNRKTAKSEDDTFWKENHSYIVIPDDSNLGFHESERVVGPKLKKKIIQDSIDYLAQEYKIHLQPKPQYQIPVIKELIKVIAENDKVKSCLDTWKAIVPYSRVEGDVKLAAIVIYPVWGEECSQTVLDEIIKHFSRFDAEEIGLDITPRLNHKYNNLIYWANGSGDHKKNLPAKYFTTKDKIFYKGHELYPTVK